MEQSVDKLCLHCSENKRVPLSKKNFSRHLQQCHNARYQALKQEGKKQCKYPEFNVDFIWAGDDDVIEPPKKR
jgi:hypothetical protein